MPTIPDTVPSRAVHIHIVGGAGGHVFLKSPALFDASGALILPATRWRATLDVSDEATITVPCTDTDTISPVGWAYKVTTSIAGVAPMGSLQVPAAGAALEFATAIQVGAPPTPAASYATLAALNAAADTLAAADTTEADARAVADTALGTAVGTAAGYAADALNRIAAIETGAAAHAALNVTNGAVVGGDLTVIGPAVTGGRNGLLPWRPAGRLTYAGPPALGTWEEGDTALGSTGIVWLCIGAGVDEGATWTSAP
jgi:hypothetical protein